MQEDVCDFARVLSKFRHLCCLGVGWKYVFLLYLNIEVIV